MDIAQLVSSSTDDLVSKMYDFFKVDFGDENAVSGRRSSMAESPTPPISKRRSSVVGGGDDGQMSTKKRGNKPQTVCGEFRRQMEELMLTINGTCPHYIRCLKPNAKNIPDVFDPQLVVHQLRCNGVLAAVQVSRAGYPNRFQYESFVRNYSCVCKLPLPKNGSWNIAA